MLYKNGYTIFWNQGVKEGSFPFSDSKKTEGNNLCYATITQPGDFNGDGLMDFFVNNNEYYWYFVLNNGDGTFNYLNHMIIIAFQSADLCRENRIKIEERI